MAGKYRIQGSIPRSPTGSAATQQSVSLLAEAFSGRLAPQTREIQMLEIPSQVRH